MTGSPLDRLGANPGKWQKVIDRLEAERQRASDIAIANHSHWEDRGDGIVAGLVLSLVIVREEAEKP